jgi:hypothetical protein
MLSNSQLQETADKTAGPPAQDCTKMIENFVRELVVDRNFKLNVHGNIVVIRHLHVAKCTVPLYVKFVFGSRCWGTRTRVKNAR